jgi:hypothetical protein
VKFVSVAIAATVFIPSTTAEQVRPPIDPCVAPGSRITPGGSTAFKTQVVDDRDEDFWREFGTILRLGGRFRTNGAFDAPYTFSAWPENLDSSSAWQSPAPAYAFANHHGWMRAS